MLNELYRPCLDTLREHVLEYHLEEVQDKMRDLLDDIAERSCNAYLHQRGQFDDTMNRLHEEAMESAIEYVIDGIPEYDCHCGREIC